LLSTTKLSDSVKELWLGVRENEGGLTIGSTQIVSPLALLAGFVW
jgi:hypothetical protein